MKMGNWVSATKNIELCGMRKMEEGRLKLFECDREYSQARFPRKADVGEVTPQNQGKNP